MTKILQCDCKHPASDKLHGVGMRHHNSCILDNKAPGWRCGVCLKEKPRNEKE